MKKLIVFILIAAAASGAGYFKWYHNVPEPSEFRTLAVQRGDLLNAISATGSIEPVEVVDVGAQIIGRIKSFGPDLECSGKTVDYGSHVKQGAIIAQLDDLPFQAHREKAAADLKLSNAESAKSRVQFQQAEQDLARAQLLRDTNSETEYDSAVAAHKIAKAEVAISAARVEQAEIALKQAEINLDYATIRSPIDGIVIDRRVNVGQTVVAGMNAPSLFLLAKDLGRMQVWAAVNEADIGLVYVDQPVTFKVDAYRETVFEGQVSQIRLNASMTHNVVTYGVIVQIDNTDGKLLPYMTANLQFEVARRRNVMLAPNQALRWRPTLDQISAEWRGKFAPAVQDDQNSDSDKVKLTQPTLWVRVGDGLVRPVVVQEGLTDGALTEIVDFEAERVTQVVVGTVRKKRQDFVSSFISRVTKSDSK